MQKKYRKKLDRVFSKLLNDLYYEVKNSPPGEGVTDAAIKGRLDNLFLLLELIRETEKEENDKRLSIDELLKKLS